MSESSLLLVFILGALLIFVIGAIFLLLFFRKGKKAGGLITLGSMALLFLVWLFLLRSSEMQDQMEASAPDRSMKVVSENETPAEKNETTTAAPETESETAAAEAETEPEPEPARVTLVAIGDMLMHPPVSGIYYKNGTLDYTDIFKPIAEEVKNADIAVVNNEVPFGGDEFGLQNYPNFNVVTALGDAEAAAGFDVILNATNHVRDMGTSGVLNTLHFWDQYPDIVAVGIHDSEEDRNVLSIIERNGMKIALFNYTYGLNAGFPSDTPYLVDMLYESEKSRIRSALERAETEADFTIVFPHWGEEYSLHENTVQTAWAEFFTECGADLIIGTHTHCLEPVKTVTAANGNTALCYYSLGNYVSMQDETVAMLGGMAEVTLLQTEEGVTIEDHGIQYLVTQYGYDMNGSYVLKLENYTRDLACQHGIPTHGFMGDNNANASHPFSYDMFYRIIEEIGGEI